MNTCRDRIRCDAKATKGGERELLRLTQVCTKPTWSIELEFFEAWQLRERPHGALSERRADANKAEARRGQGEFGGTRQVKSWIRLCTITTKS